MNAENDQDRLLRLATYWKSRKLYKHPAIGDVLKGYIRRNVRPKKRTSPVVRAWKNVVPSEMDEFCTIESFSNGVLKVSVSEPTYRFQMEMLKGELIESIDDELKGKVKLRDIRFV